MVADLGLVWVCLNSMLVCFNFDWCDLVVVYVVNLTLVLASLWIFVFLVVWLVVVNFLWGMIASCFYV